MQMSSNFCKIARVPDPCRFETFQTSGLSKMVGDQLMALRVLPPWSMVLLLVAIVAMLTEVTSNTAVITLVTPMLFTMVRKNRSMEAISVSVWKQSMELYCI